MSVRGEELARAARDVARLADEHARDLDRFASLAISQGLRGPGAYRLAEEYGGVRRRLHSAFDHAWNSLATAARREDGSPGPGPGLPPGPLIAGRGGGTVSVDADLLRKASGGAREAGSRLDGAAAGLASVLAAAGVDASPTAGVRAAAAWARAQAEDLRRRADLAEGADQAITDVFADALTAGTLTGADPRLSALTGAELAAYAELRRIQAGGGPGTDRTRRTATWWSHLPQTTRTHLRTTVPGMIGSLDGLPASDRDAANRIFMRQEKKRLEALVKDPFALNRPGGAQQNAWAAQQLEAIKAVEDRIAREGKDGHPRVYLLAFDTQGPGHIAVSFDNPDTADNVTTFVPGFGTNLASTELNLQRAERIRREAIIKAPRQTTASIYWLGYEPPQVDGSAIQTAFDAVATRAAKPFGGFMHGLEASRIAADDAHSTVLGHSYGSLVTGKTAVEFPHLADELIFVGSPGVGVNHASELGIAPGHVWASEAPDDLVAKAPAYPKPEDPQYWISVLADQGQFGTHPTAPKFGAKTFASDSGGHSGYWDSNFDSPSLRNIARIVVGREPNEN